MSRVPSTQQDVTRAYTPAALALRWQCSERHVRNLVAKGKLRAFRLGEKLLRIPVEAVEEMERCPAIELEGSAVDLSSCSSREESAAGSGLTPKMQARLTVLRRESSHS